MHLGNICDMHPIVSAFALVWLQPVEGWMQQEQMRLVALPNQLSRQW